MFHIFPILLAFMILFFSAQPAGTGLPPERSIWLAVGGSILIPYLFGLAVAFGVRRIAATPSRVTVPFFRRVRRILSGYTFLILAAFFVACYVYGWPDYVRLRITQAPGLETVVSLAPFLISLILLWTVQAGVESALTIRRWKLSERLWFQLRHALVPLAPVIILITVEGFLIEWRWLDEIAQHPGYEEAPMIASFGAVLIVFAFFPLLVRLLWPVEPIGPGRLGDRLRSMAVANRVTLRNVLLWKTGGGNVMNACMLGMVPPLRYILMSDALLNRLEEDEACAVFGHELCHAKRNHVLYYGMFLVSMMLLLSVLGWGEEDTAEGWIQLIGTMLVWLLTFGFISRRFERECDLFGARAVGSHLSFIRALQKIAPGPSSLGKLHSFLHDSIAHRVAFLIQADADPIYAERFLRKVGWIRAGILTLFALVTILSVATA